MNQKRLLGCLVAVVALSFAVPGMASATDGGCSNTAHISTFNSTPTCGLALTKSGPDMTHIGDVETYQYSVTSTGSLAPAVDKETGLVDDKCSPVTYVSGDTNSNGKVDTGETWAFTCDYEVIAEHVNESSRIVNTATVTGSVQWMSSSSSSKVARASTSSDCSKSSRVRKSSDEGGSCGGGGCESKVRKSTDGGSCGGCESRARKSTDSGCGGSEDGCGETVSRSSKARSSTYGSGDDDCPEIKTATVKATATWTMLVVFPGIDVKKEATQSRVTTGGAIDYKITVTNTGTVALTVTPQDLGCTAFDATPFALAVGATHALTCQHVTSAGDGALYTNQACATGMDAAGGTANDCDHVDTPIDPPATTSNNPTPPGNQVVAGQQAPAAAPGGQIVLGERIAAGTARLLGQTGCAARAFNARVRGTQIARVTFVLDGKTIKRLTRPNLSGAFAVRVDPRKVKLGVHRLVANVTFKSGSGTKAKHLRLSFQRCSRALRAPRFTG